MMFRRIAPMMKAASTVISSAGLVLLLAPAVSAQSESVSMRDSFPIGSNGLCEAQIDKPKPGDGLFDRNYTIICRDVAAPVGTLHVLRAEKGVDVAQRFIPQGGTCDSASVDAGRDNEIACTLADGVIQRTIAITRDGRKTYVATGLSAYRDALSLGLSVLRTDRLVEGDVNIPLVQSRSTQAFARARAEAISPDAAMIEGYRRSNAGRFAEAAEFFATSARSLAGPSASEATLNAALQQSNLGNYAEAARLFASIETEARSDLVLARLWRNFRAIDALNQDDPQDALFILAEPLPSNTNAAEALMGLEVTAEMSRRISAEQAGILSGLSGGLTPLERAELLEGQSEYVRATALRMIGNTDPSRRSLERANSLLANVREGRVSSIIWLRGQIMAELASHAERQGDSVTADRHLAEAVALMGSRYPDSPAWVSARAQQAAFFSRSGRQERARVAFRELVDEASNSPSPSLRRLLKPYFELIVSDSDNERASRDMFAASQLMVRPGLAQTQAVLARELAGGSDQAAQLFRRSINLSRAIRQARPAIDQLSLRAEKNPLIAGALVEKQAELDALLKQQLVTQQQLARYPRYRAIDDDRIDLDELQQSLQSGEAYLKFIMVGDEAFAIFVGKEDTLTYRLAADPVQLDRLVDKIRFSIAYEEAGRTVTEPFDMVSSRELHQVLLSPLGNRLSNISHLIVEPDGALLRLPLNLLVTDNASVESYNARLAADDGDAFDFRGTAWLGRSMSISTAVSVASFRDVRNAPRAKGQRAYLGMGQNVPLGNVDGQVAEVRSGTAAGIGTCEWPYSNWNRPILPDEINAISGLFADAGQGAALLTKGDFSDTAILQRDDLDDYRILHFATHGLVTTPNPDCPPRPALLTSFGDEASDGLLSFAEIFDLQIDADLVILSACNTASGSGTSATEEAGLDTVDGDFALDGLVRAFVGAGARTVLASHWPVSDDYDATAKLMIGLFDRNSRRSVGDSLRQSQEKLMDAKETSHPYYWSAFAIVGDGMIGI